MCADGGSVWLNSIHLVDGCVGAMCVCARVCVRERRVCVDVGVCVCGRACV